MRTSTGCFNEQGSMTLTINGKVLTWDEYKKTRDKAKRDAAKNKRKKNTSSFVQLLAPYVTRLIKNVTILKSLAAYYDHGYRQWGRICRDNVINNPFISAPFLTYRMKAYDIANLVADIENIGKRNEKDVFQFIEKLSYKIDDAKHSMEALVKGVNESRVCEFYADSECINGEGRRLGLSILMIRSLHALDELDKLFKELQEISHDGLDPMEYDALSGGRIYKHGYVK